MRFCSSIHDAGDLAAAGRPRGCVGQNRTRVLRQGQRQRAVPEPLRDGGGGYGGVRTYFTGECRGRHSSQRGLTPSDGSQGMVSFERDHPLRDPQRNTRGKPLDLRTAMGNQPFGESTMVQVLLTIWCASYSAWPLLRIWYENSCEFCPKPRRRAAERRKVAEGNETALHQRLSGYRRRPSRKRQRNRQAVLCAARAASVWQGRTMNGSRAKPVRVFSPLLRGQKRCSRSGDAS